MDGCFGPVRKKSAGMDLLPPKHKNTFFVDQADVDKFVQDYGRKAKDAQTVSKIYTVLYILALKRYTL